MSDANPEAALDSHPMTAGEYAKVQAIVRRVEGLRRAMLATALAGMAVSTFSFVYTGLRINSATGFFTIRYTADTLARALLYSIFLYLPVILILGFFSNRVNKHLEQLASGRYERTIVVDYLLPDEVRPGAQEKK
ncbi:MAG TPA: hypothetical protein VLY21_07075 [Nitrososphaerales archaeon]|nr:hypothetical protein [Nitrososphaerales archaeon]